MSETSWKLLSVSDFCDRYRTLSELKVAQKEDSISLGNLVWQRQTVQAFFANCQWSPKPAVATSTEAFGLKLSVQSYFQHFIWDAPVPALQTADKVPDVSTGPESSVNLQNFADLF